MENSAFEFDSKFSEEPEYKKSPSTARKRSTTSSRSFNLRTRTSISSKSLIDQGNSNSSTSMANEDGTTSSDSKQSNNSGIRRSISFLNSKSNELARSTSVLKRRGSARLGNAQMVKLSDMNGGLTYDLPLLLLSDSLKIAVCPKTADEKPFLCFVEVFYRWLFQLCPFAKILFSNDHTDEHVLHSVLSSKDNKHRRISSRRSINQGRGMPNSNSCSFHHHRNPSNTSITMSKGEIRAAKNLKDIGSESTTSLPSANSSLSIASNASGDSGMTSSLAPLSSLPENVSDLERKSIALPLNDVTTAQSRSKKRIDFLTDLLALAAPIGTIQGQKWTLPKSQVKSLSKNHAAKYVNAEVYFWSGCAILYTLEERLGSIMDQRMIFSWEYVLCETLVNLSVFQGTSLDIVAYLEGLNKRQSQEVFNK
eukprot:Awhi_evm1s15262